MKKFTLLLFSFFLLFNVANAQKVKNIKWERDSNLIVINYDLVSLIKGNTFNVQLFCSTDGGYVYNIPLRNAIGDVGTDIRLGKKKTVAWDVFKDVGGLAGMVSFRVVAEKNPIERNFFFAYNGSIDAPLGIQIGLLGGISPYVGLRFNMEYDAKYNYVYDKTELISEYPHETIYFIYGDKIKRPRYSITAGVNAQVFNNGFIYLGGGYGVSNLLWEVNEYNYADDSLNEVSWAINNEWSESGIEIEAGVIIPLKNFLIKGGGTTINFKRPVATFGIGYRF